MNWLLRRVFVLCLILAVTFAAVLLVARLSRTPDALQALGFDVCDGEPCFRGITLGTDWSQVQKITFPLDGKKDYAYISLNTANVGYIGFYGLKGKVEAIYIEPPYGILRLPFTVGHVIARYGWPCRLVIEHYDSAPSTMFLQYPNMQIRTDVTIGDPHSPLEYRLLMNSFVYFFVISTEDTFGTCDFPPFENSGPWRGFTSVEVYQSRNRRDFGSPQP